MVTFCKWCGGTMRKVMHFEEGKASTFFRCEKCYTTSKPKKMDLNSYGIESKEVVKGFSKTDGR